MYVRTSGMFSLLAVRVVSCNLATADKGLTTVHTIIIIILSKQPKGGVANCNPLMVEVWN